MRAGFRSSLVWICLLGAIEAMDILTTHLGRAAGAVESMPISAAVMAEGGMGLFIIVKLALVVAGAVAVCVTSRQVESLLSGHPADGAALGFAEHGITDDVSGPAAIRFFQSRGANTDGGWSSTGGKAQGQG